MSAGAGQVKPYSADFMKALGQQMPPGVVATGKPGEFMIQGVGLRKFADMRQDVLYDRVELLAAPGPIAAGTEFVFFRDIQGKTRLETNMTQSQVLPEGQEAIIYRINVMALPETPPEDMELFLSYGYGEFVLDDDLRARSGPLVTFASAYGAYGNIMTTNTTVVDGTLANGVPSAGAQPRLMLPLYIAEKRTFRFSIIFYEAITLSAGLLVYVMLDVLQTRPLR